MITYEMDEHTVIEAEEGFLLKSKVDGSIWGKAVSLGIYDSPENYEEVDESTVPVEEDSGIPYDDEEW